MKKIKNLIVKIIGFKNYRSILVFLFRLTNNIHIKKWICVDKKYYKQLSKKNKNIFFGYYDYTSENENKILFLSTENDLNKKADIYYYNNDNGQEKYISSTNTWNYQMGSRIRWIDNKKIIFNDYDKKIGFISRIVDLNGHEENRYSFPIFDISVDKKYSFYTNFSILNYFRPGYGYTNEKIKNINKDIMLQNGIYKGDFSNNKSEIILSMEEIIKYKFDTNFKEKFHYINHIYVSPYNSIIMFFHLWFDEKNNLRNRVFIIDYFGKILNIIDDFDRASHYAFKSKNEILLTVMIKDKTEYRLYNLKDGKYKLFDFLTVDGHPSYIDNNIFITDTYPDHNGMQHIFLCDDNGIKSELVQIYHNPRKNGEYRCDLHPRYSNGILTFDSINHKYRSQNILNINLLTKDLEVFPKTDRAKRIYMNLYNKIDTNAIKILFSKVYNHNYKAHLLVDKMFNTSSKIKKFLYFNKLQYKYSMWISPKCNIGRNIHFMHLDGIHIGSGVKIGNNCTLYQQVTLGREKGKFPVIGNNVTIYAGAKIIGDVKIGNNAIIGANAVVLKDVPDNCVAVGVPAKVIERKEDTE